MLRTESHACVDSCNVGNLVDSRFECSQAKMEGGEKSVTFAPGTATGPTKRKAVDSIDPDSASKKSKLEASEPVSAPVEEQELDSDEDVDPDDEERIRMAALLETFTPEQLRRFEHFRRSHLKKHTVKQVMLTATSEKLNERLLVSMGGIAKVFAGELVEAARFEMERNKETGPIRPRHVRTAFHQMVSEGRLPYCKSNKKILM